MKRIIRLAAILCAVPLLFSCDPSEGDPQPVIEEEPQPETRTLTFVLPTGEDGATPIKSAWVPGDKIVVHGEYAKSQVTVTLESGDISSDGMKATKTVEGLFPYVRKDCKSSLYAAYPADAVDNLKHCFFYSKFSSTSDKLLAASNDGDILQFHNVCGAFSFSADGGFDAYQISGQKKEAVGYEFLQVKVTDDTQNFNQYLGKAIYTLDGKMNSGETVVCIPDGLSAEGLVIKLFKGGEQKGTIKYKQPVEGVRGFVQSLGDLTSLIIPYENPFSSDIKDLDKEGNANCYIVTEPGKYKFKAVMGNSTQSIAEPSETVVLWETWNNDRDVTRYSVVASASYAEDYIVIHMPETLTPGNAVVAAMDADGKALWSWHIWVPSTAIKTQKYSVWKTDMMDRNLGALVAPVASSTPNPVEAYGLTYQWGRKDPFVGPAAVTGDDNATVAGLEVSEAPGTISVQTAIEQPTYMGHSNSADWTDEHSTTLWQNDVKTMYDPCPPGYKVPARDKSTDLFSSDVTKVAGWQVDKTNYWIKLGEPAAVFPIGGYRDDYGPSEMAKNAKRVAIWSAYSSSDGVGYHLNWRPDGGTFKLGECGKARGGYVRCVKE